MKRRGARNDRAEGTRRSILVCDPLAAAGIDALESAGAEVDLLDPADKPRLAEMVGDYDAIIVRSGTDVTEEILRAGERLDVVGRAGIGVDNVDVAAATELGILVVNAPTANLISATEHTFALMLALARNVAAADAAMRDRIWDRTRFVGQELQQKRLGVIGFGRIGQQVAERARAFDMEVVAHDPYLDTAVAERLDVALVDIDELLDTADVVTLHVPMTDETRGLLGADELGRMRPGALLVNCARGGVVDEEALLTALDDGPLGGAALDVFDREPPSDWRLVEHPKTVTTPHIGAQTREARERIALQTAKMVMAALDGSLAISAVNLPFRAAGSRGEPFLRLGEQLGRLAGAMLSGGARRLQVDLWGIDEDLRVPITVAATKGLLTPYLGEAVNYVNAEAVAADRGVEVVRATHHESGDYPYLVGVRLVGDGRELSLAGTFFDDRQPRVVDFDGYRLEFRPEGRLLVLSNRDVPGVVGKLGTLLGEGEVNIAAIHLARRVNGEDAVAVLRLDDEPPSEILERIVALEEVHEARVVTV